MHSNDAAAAGAVLGALGGAACGYDYARRRYIDGELPAFLAAGLVVGAAAGGLLGKAASLAWGNILYRIDNLQLP